MVARMLGLSVLIGLFIGFFEMPGIKDNQGKTIDQSDCIVFFTDGDESKPAAVMLREWWEEGVTGGILPIEDTRAKTWFYSKWSTHKDACGRINNSLGRW